MAWVAGVDGCRGGWFVVLANRRSGRTGLRVVERFPEILRLPEKPAVVAVDIPIGLLERAVRGGRECDREARRLLGQPRGRSVFSPPVRSALRSDDYPSANRANKASSPEKVGISIQSFGLSKKLLEADEFMTGELQNIVKEVHPELSFYELKGKKPMKYSKKARGRLGLAERQKLLVGAGFEGVISELHAHHPAKVAEDDILDACVACWTAQRITRGQAIWIPEDPPCDGRGLRMEVWR